MGSLGGVHIRFRKLARQRIFLYRHLEMGLLSTEYLRTLPKDTLIPAEELYHYDVDLFTLLAAIKAGALLPEMLP